ncbi:hypothetical protein PG990_011977 [Apiospora arundinis]
MNQPAPTTKAWLYSESSTGRYLGSLRVSPVRRMDFWEAMGVARREFTEVIQPKLISYLRENSTEISTSTCMLNLSLFMMGKSSLKTKPTVMFVSEDKKVRKEALNLAKKSDILLEYPGFALGECKLIAEFAGQRQIGDHRDKLTSPSGGTDDPLELFTDSTFCSAGARICANQPDRVSTIGGLLLTHGGATMGLTVGHILHSESTPDMMESDGSEDECEFIGLDELDENTEDDEEGGTEFVDSTSQASGSPVALPSSCNSDTASVSSSDFDDDVDSSFGFGAIGQGTTEPGLDQPTALTVNHESEFTSKVGHVNFSSKPLDYCVFSIELGLGSQPRPNTKINLRDLKASLEYEPRETQISIFSERAGEIRGTMKAFSSYCRFPSATNFQEVFTAKLDMPLIAGDCGSWVYDTQTNKLFGHVVAASVGATVITIMPARDVFGDISARFTPRHPDWDAYKDTLRHMYLVEDRTLDETVQIMKTVYAFEASHKMYKEKFRVWRWQKNLPTRTQVLFMAKAKARRETKGKETVFRFGGRVLDASQVESMLVKANKRVRVEETAGGMMLQFNFGMVYRKL